MFSSVAQVPQTLSELRLVQLSDLTKREIIIGRLPLTVQMSATEDWQSLYEAAGNPTKWYRQPFVLIVVVKSYASFCSVATRLAIEMCKRTDTAYMHKSTSYQEPAHTPSTIKLH